MTLPPNTNRLIVFSLNGSSSVDPAKSGLSPGEDIVIGLTELLA